ncbi:MAG TPA: helix-turn-helix domain-containing protein [Candidatus Saccharimonadales bacterium]|nr:helix-turn-helix domain-containing protein [Candidatus Saccharimonadales bacterium]
MTQRHINRPSSHPLIDRVWHTKNIEDGVYVATPDCAWDLLALELEDGSRHMMLAGQQTTFLRVPYRAGTSAVVISFDASAYLAGMKGDELLDATVMLPNMDRDHFVLLGRVFRFPNYDEAEELAQAMVEAGILKQDDVVASILSGEPRAMSSRTMQRHFHDVTGISRKGLEKISRAQEAVKLLQTGTASAEVAAEVGYTDQAHLTKDLKNIMGSGTINTDYIHKL